MRKTRKGNVFKVVAEHYLRDDIWCGSALCTECKHGEGGAALGRGKRLLVLDTNVCLHQIDILESDVFSHVILLQTVLEETRHRSYAVYQRLLRLANESSRCWHIFSNEHHRFTYIERERKESPNDRNDRAIRAATRWYAAHLGSRAEVTLVTNDRENRERAEREGLRAVTVRAFVEGAASGEKLKSLLDRMAEVDAAEGDWKSAGRSGGVLYDAHVPLSKALTEIEAKRLFRGTFKVDRSHWKQAEVRARGAGFERPVLIEGLDHMNRALDGDEVAIRVFDESKWSAPEIMMPRGPGEVDEAEAAREGARQPTGKVVAVLQRNSRAYCGSLELNERTQALESGRVNFISVDRRLPKVAITSRQVQRLLDKRILVQIDDWPRDSRWPRGHYVRTIGLIGDMDCETNVLLLEHEIPTHAWAPKVLKCLPPKDFTISDEEAARRLDLRTDTLVMSIDPPGCTDIDDALHCKKLPNGNFECGVHIADVTHYVREGSALDLEALNRSTSVYLVQRRIDMIPSMLSTDLCSLRANVDRLAFSCIWEMTPDAEIVATRFHKTVIRSRAAYAYGDAQDILDDPKANDENALAVKRLNRLAKILKARRLEAGALTLASPQIKFMLDPETRRPRDAQMYKLKEANALVEEFMLLANISVAKQILRAFPTFAVLRRHPVPSPTQFDLLVRGARVKGFELDVSTSRKLAESLDRCVVEGFPYFNTLIRVLATRCMTQAVYFSSGSVEAAEYQHYGLATPIYTHFTSPIRRYSDVLVHRLLAASLRIDPVPTTLENEEKSRHMCEHMNHRHRMAQLVGRASSGLFTLIYFRERDVVEEAIVFSVRKNGIRVFIPKYGIEGSIHVVNKAKAGQDPEAASRGGDDDQKAARAASEWEFDAEKLLLRNKCGGQQFQIFDRLKVRIYVKRSKMRREWLEMELVGRDGEGGGQGPVQNLVTAVMKKRKSAESSDTKRSQPKKKKSKKKASSSPARKRRR